MDRIIFISLMDFLFQSVIIVEQKDIKTSKNMQVLVIVQPNRKNTMLLRGVS